MSTSPADPGDYVRTTYRPGRVIAREVAELFEAAVTTAHARPGTYPCPHDERVLCDGYGVTPSKLRDLIAHCAKNRDVDPLVIVAGRAR